jgi:hypothetical protein
MKLSTLEFSSCPPFGLVAKPRDRNGMESDGFVGNSPLTLMNLDFYDRACAFQPMDLDSSLVQACCRRRWTCVLVAEELWFAHGGRRTERLGGCHTVFTPC